MRKTTIASLLLNGILICICLLLNIRFNRLADENLLCKKKIDGLNGKEISKETLGDENDPLYVFYSKKFHCDSGSKTSYDSNLCIEEKLKFADSLLTQHLERKFAALDKYIRIDKEAILKDKDNVFFINALKINTVQKENLIKSQKLWENMRTLNSENVKLSCDGSTGCSGIVSAAETSYVLKRIEEIKNIKAYN